MALTALGVVGPARDVLAAVRVPRTIGLEQVELAAHQRLSTLAEHSSYGREVGEALQTTLADLANQIGWLAIDAERRSVSRQYLHEAISRARLVDDPRVEVRALACLSLLTRSQLSRHSDHQLR